MTMVRHELATTALVFGLIVLMALGLAQVIKSANVKMEARCAAQGGQVIVTPGEVSRCLLPASR